MLFVPGNRSSAIDRAWTLDADLLCVDLEDAVPMNAKTDARNHVARLLETSQLDRHAIRLNVLSTEDGLRDLLMLCEALRLPAVLVIPKVDHVEQVSVVASLLRGKYPSILPMIEGARGLANAAQIAAHAASVGLLFGGADLAGDRKSTRLNSSH